MDNDKVIIKKIATGLEWLDGNYDTLDETTKHAFDELILKALSKCYLSMGPPKERSTDSCGRKSPL